MEGVWGDKGKRGGGGNWEEMTQTLYTHMNKIKIKKKKKEKDKYSLFFIQGLISGSCACKASTLHLSQTSSLFSVSMFCFVFFT
jgi:hypothetical protein